MASQFKNIDDAETEYELYKALYGDKWDYFQKDSNNETKWHYAGTVNQQKNTNQTKRIDWSNMGNAVGKSDNYATSQYTKKTTTDKKTKKKTTTYNHPWKVTAHNFDLGLPSNAYIDFVVIQVCMKSSKKGEGTFPSTGFYVNDKHTDVKDSKTATGWHNGTYWDTSDMKLAKTDKTATYFIRGVDINKAGYTIENFNSDYFGVDFNFSDKCDSQTLYLKWVRCKVFYTLPKYTLTHNYAGNSEKNPWYTNTGVDNTVKFTLKQTSKLDGGSQSLKLDIPYGTEVVDGYPKVSTGSLLLGNIWTVNAVKGFEGTLTVKFKDYTVDTQAITLKGLNNGIAPNPPSSSFYYHSNYNFIDDYGAIVTQLLTTYPHKREDCCFQISGRVLSSYDTSVQIDLTKDFSYESFSCELLNADEGVSINTSLTDANKITLNVPRAESSDFSEGVNFVIRVCYHLTDTGWKYLEPKIHNGTPHYNKVNFKIAEPYEYHFSSWRTTTDEENGNAYFLLRNEDVGFINHRIASELDTGAYILPCRVKEHDSLMIQSKPQIHMYKWEQLDYIGCVPLEHLHFDPKSTYKDKLLDSHYKNKRYMGKELAPDEDITLNVRLHPQQVTTIQGLIDMDKPIPINANHRCFEGDSLNHRGWCEIYGIKTEETNPHWYKCDIDVKYLTHNLNTRFKINKGTKTFSKYPMPTLLLESVGSGDALQGDTDAEDYFIVNTDGGYIYNEEEIQSTWYKREDDGVEKIVIFVVDGSEEEISHIEQEFADYDILIITGETELDFETLLQEIVEEGYIIINAQIGRPIEVDDTEYSNESDRNVFTLDEGQSFNIRTKYPLSTVSQVSYEWASTLLPEYKENAISKIVRLVDDSSKNAMVEYEYTDFDFSEYTTSTTTLSDNEIIEIVGGGQIACHVIVRAYRKGDYEEVYNEDIHIPTSLMDEDEDIEDYSPTYGSTVTFKLNGNRLVIEDTGYTGKEVHTEEIELEGSSYYWEVEWKNRNTDGEDNDISTYVNITVQDSLLASQYASKYSNMIVSPFPVSDKQLIFTRNAEEGVIYYYNDDKEEFSYLIEPYYQYHNGTDLRSADSISIFNLNYGYKSVYLENGLVSLGINRLNGQMYLRKWDNESKQYITISIFQLTNYDDVNINSISDDRIELQASNTLISIYRGHPYIILKHGLESIQILNTWATVWAEQVGTDVQDYPKYFDLLNTANLLPTCVGGKNTIDRDCVKIYECGDTVYSDIDKDLYQIYDLQGEEATFLCPDLDEVSLELTLPQTDIIEDEDATFGVSGTNLVADDKIYFIINGDVVEDRYTSYPDDIVQVFEESGVYDVCAVFIGDDTRSHAISPTYQVEVKSPAPPDDPSPTPTPTPTDPCPKPQSGKYKLTMESPKKFKYRDNQEVKFRLTRGGLPVCGKTVEMVDFKYINSELTNRNGYVNFKNHHLNTTPKKYKIGARFFEGDTDKPLTKIFKDVEVKKSDAEWVVRHYAGKTGEYASFKLRNKDNPSDNIANQSVTIYVNGKAYKKKTNDNGNIFFKITKKGEYKYKCTFGGSTGYNKAKESFKEKVVDN